MLTLSQLRKKYRAVSPMDMLDDLITIITHPKKEDFRAPVLSITMISGYSFKGYLINGSGPDDVEKSYLFAAESPNLDSGANDLIYVQGHRIESVIVWNVSDYSGILPRMKSKNPQTPE